MIDLAIPAICFAVWIGLSVWVTLQQAGHQGEYESGEWGDL